MSYGKSVKLFLTDGTLNGILTAEITNWTGHIVSIPRNQISSLIQRKEANRTGIYFLINDEEDPLYPKVYIGESDNIGYRLKQHENKKFWNKACIVTGKDQNLTKTHIKYLESRLIQIVLSNSQCQLINATTHIYDKLPESDKVDMGYFLEQIKIILPILGYHFLEVSKITPPTDDLAKFIIKTKEVYATAKIIKGDFYVLKGSQVRKDVKDPNCCYLKNLRPKLIAEKIIDPETYIFTKDYHFSKPSAASTVILGYSSNGRTAWKHVETNQTFADWEESALNTQGKSN
ncbi:GIY-YIG nuclease family protein [Acinetobacter sp. HY1485]|uniref:GIY-YIG nuclease family protein n=1 Tax=Acinetobacter sp. HY1485 TaxID=2970918 RepID=UPI0022B9CF29|nr:GIY-YIG nuclease family protein [Acinetobacter sp. HY1485]